jgi:hypothetical protein
VGAASAQLAPRAKVEDLASSRLIQLRKCGTVHCTSSPGQAQS